MADTTYITDFMTGFGYAFFVAICLIILVVFVFILYKYPSLVYYPFTLIMNFFLNFFNNNNPMIGADNCAVIPGSKLNAVSRVPSTYLAHVSFFFAFLFTNAYTIYTLAKEDGSSNEQYENRRNRTAMIMAILVFLYIVIVAVRFNVTGCESHFGVAFTTLLFGGLGVGAYKFAEICGARSSDVLGISTSFVSNNAENPVVCGTAGPKNS